ncbi:MAG: PEP/pyruvate-binding domain-containing protein, partial [Bacteroidota bacterium]|nr:PEP/pyruvate-binding domain-containing protein [Bacteroidota bacterium]
PQEVRRLCLTVFEKVREKKLRGRIVLFDSGLVNSNRYILRMGKGSLGGKGRGMAFLSHFVENIDFKKIIPNINIRIPATSIIGSQEFDKFIEINNLYTEIYSRKNFNKVKELFLNAHLSDELNDRLFHYLLQMKKPLAIRSSGLFEDSLMQPFSGVYSTYLIPNNHPDLNVRFEQLVTAVKLVYASIFTKSSQSYFDAVNYKIEEEKMAVIIQELVGHTYNKRFYPHISGVAQSYNYYPFSYMKPDDGFSVAAVGLGMYVVGGEKAYRFCPRYPELSHNSVSDQIRDSQKEFYAIDLTRTDFDLNNDGELATVSKYKIREAEKDGTLTHCVSTYDMLNDRLNAGIAGTGPKVVDFANILKYNYIPLAETLRFLLRLFREAMGAPVEIEYAVDLTKDDRGNPTFYLLQIKPLLRIEDQIDIELGEIDRNHALMISHRGMGNGDIEGIRDIVYVMPENFDRTLTKEIAAEIGEINRVFEQSGGNYILIGPGRWGTRDRFTGIPVHWAHISHAKVIVEMGLKDFPLDASLGSHFFHNVTSMNVGYFSVPFESSEFTLQLDKLKNQEIVWQGEYACHVRFKEDLKILMDGRSGTAVILVPDENDTTN